MNRILTVFVFLLNFAAAIPENLTLPVYSLQIDSSYLDALQADPHSDQYYPAIFIYQSYAYTCMVRYRGETSRNLPKKSFKIKFDEENNLLQTEVINLNAEYEDNTLMRNYLGHALLTYMGQPAPRGKHISLIVNDQFYGVYLQIEQVDEDFFFRRNLDIQACFKGYNGADMSPFLYHHLLPIVWGLKIGPENAFDHLELFMNKLTYWTETDFATHIKDEINIENTITYFALIFATTNYDGIHKNFYFYRQSAESVYEMIAWDMDCTFGNDADGIYHQAYETSRDIGILGKHVLFLRLMDIPEYQKLFWQKVDEIRDSGFPYLQDVIINTYNNIKNDFYQDPQKRCSVDEFDQAVAQLQSYVVNRGNFLQNTLSFDPLSLYEPSCSYCDSMDQNTVKFRIKSRKKQNIILYLAKNLTFGQWNGSVDTETLQLYDDGQHSDEQARDLVYANTLTLTEAHQGVIPYAFYTANESSPLHGFFYLTYHTHIGPALNIDAYKTDQHPAVRIGAVMRLDDEYIVPIINPTTEVMDLSHFHFQAGPYYQRIVFPVTTAINPQDSIFLTSDLELMQEIFPEKTCREHIYFKIRPGDTLKILSPFYSEIVSEMCREINPISIGFKNIVITEINYNSHVNHDTEDWLELYNPNFYTLDISDWYFQDSKRENIYRFPPNSKISPYQTVIVCKEKKQFKSYYPEKIQILGNFDFNLKNEGEYICISDESGNIIDSLTYGNRSPWPENTNGTGYTLVLDDPNSDNADAANWRASYQIGGTPGKVIDLSLSNQEIPEEPKNFVLDQNYPNPFNATTKIRYFLLKPAHVEIKLFTITGQYITSLENKYQHDGCYQCSIPTNDLSSGIYIYSLYLNHRLASSRKALLIK